VRAVDSAGVAAEVAKSIAIVPALSVSGSCEASPCSVEQGCDTVCGGFGSQTGGLAPYQYAASGALPPATSLIGLSLAGPFTQVSSFSFAVKVIDALGATRAIKVAFNVFPHISLKGGTFTGQLSGFTVALPYSGGSGVPKVTLGKGPLPPNTSVSVDSRASQVVISGGAQRGAGSYPFVLVLTDGSPCGASSNCSTSANVTINVG
jgi:hypothetical protein